MALAPPMLELPLKDVIEALGGSVLGNEIGWRFEETKTALVEITSAAEAGMRTGNCYGLYCICLLSADIAHSPYSPLCMHGQQQRAFL